MTSTNRVTAERGASADDPAPSRRAARLTPMLGPAAVAAIAYIDPGNVATNLTAGATSGYLLVWVVVAASLVALLVQFQSAKLGVATGRSLPELCRERLPRWASLLLWAQAELVVLATDLAEFVGAAIGLRLLFGMPVAPAALVTAAVSMVLLELRRRGRRRFELLTAAALLLVGAGVLYDVVAVGHQSAAGLAGGLVPRLDGVRSALLAMGIVGATVMPHAIYLHSALARRPDPGAAAGSGDRSPSLVRRALRLDCGIALGGAAVVNVAMIALGAGLGALTAGAWTGDIIDAHAQIAGRAGGAAALAFAVALLASGVSSSGIGTLAGDFVMQGFLGWQIPSRVRRLVTMVPALVALLAGAPLTGLLVVSQVVISLGVPVALFLLVHFCRDRSVMGGLVNAAATTRVAAGAGLVVAAVGLSLPVLLLL
ncbi:Nramp family divalent metal transporter [Dactylosporangium sp. NPDC048998]|uniref:Nramp family divalent metal transporter n=1 Tax=Dactylosporangium sp. NPDC048998 TaxID=3363976 RepID=UPI00371D024D